MTTCPASTDPPSATKQELHNWSGALKFTPGTIFFPTTRGEIVRVIQQAENANQSVKVIGSVWSFTPLFEATDVVIDSTKITGPCDPRILDGLTFRDPSVRDSLCHIRGGTKVYNVNRMLHDPSLKDVFGIDPYQNLPLTGSSALPTMGGSGGQSIAGVLATGSHGGDVHMPPLADFVEAIHLIGPAGQEFWIERGRNSLTVGDTQGALRTLAQSVPEDMCDGVIVIRNDDTFDAALVSVGRMGFVYSLVLRTVPTFFLSEMRKDDFWDSFSTANLTAAKLPGYTAAGTLLDGPLRFAQVLVMPFQNARGHTCKIAERMDLKDLDSPVRSQKSSGFMQWLCSVSDWRALLPQLIAAVALLVALLVLLTKAATALAALIASVSAIPIFGWALAAALTVVLVVVVAMMITLVLAIATLLMWIGAVIAGDTSATHDILANIAALWYAIGLKDAFRRLAIALFNGVYTSDPTEDVSFRVMDTYNYTSDDQCQKVDSMDVAFDATAAGNDRHLAFVNQVLAMFDEFYDRSVPVLGIVALRFTSRSEALIAMTRFALTCHVEVPLIRGFQGNEEFMSRAQKAAIALGGVPHWGQVMSGYTVGDTDALHAPDIDRWRASLGALIMQAGGKTFTFSNDFTQTYDLEPPDAGLPDNCGEGGPFEATTLGTINGPGPTRQTVPGDVDIKRIDNGANVSIRSLHGSITVDEKIDNKSSATLVACGTVKIKQTIDQGSYASITAHGDVTIGEKIDQHSSAAIKSEHGGITIGQKIDQHSKPVSLSAATFVLIVQKVDQYAEATIEAGADVTIGQGIDAYAAVTINGAQTVSIGKKVDQHSRLTVVAEGDVTIGEGIDQHAQVEITSKTGNIFIKKAVDGNAKAILKALKGNVTIGEKVAGGATVTSTKPFFCPSPGNAVTLI